MDDDTAFARLVSLACHDLRTPLATVSGFAKTLTRADGLEDPATRYVAMIQSAAAQMAELLDELGIAARIQAGRYEPVLRDADTLELAQAAAHELGEDRVAVTGAGALVRVDPVPTGRAIAALAQSALRHGGLDEVSLAVDGPALRLSPITDASRPVVLGEDLRDLGAAVAGIVVRTLGAELSADGATLLLRLPTEAPAAS